MQKIGRYELVREIGRGGFGVVYEARDPLMDRTVAIKVMVMAGSDSASEAESQLARFRREAQITGNLNHPNLVTMFELGEWEGKPFLAMEFLRGRDLGEVIKLNQRLTLMERLDIITQAASGLARAHEAGVVHRDIKPPNIFVLEDRRVKVMDFGIARMSSLKGQTITRAGHQLGSFPWMAPEQFNGFVDFQSDIWALGVTAYELLTGVHPFMPGGREFSTEEVFRRIVMAEYPDPLSQAPDLPPAAGELLCRMLKKDRSIRYAAMDDLRLDLESLLAEEKQRQAKGLLSRATVQRLEGEAETALQLVREALGLDNTNREGHELRRQLQDEVRSKQANIHVISALAEADRLAEAQSWGAALNVLENARSLDPNHSGIQRRIITIAEQQQRAGRVERLWAEAQQAMGRHELDTARRLAQQLLLEEPGHPGAAGLMEQIGAVKGRVARLQQLTDLLQSARERMSAGDVERGAAMLGEFDRQGAGSDLPSHLRGERLEMEERVRTGRAAAGAIRMARERLSEGDFAGALQLLRALTGVPQQEELAALRIEILRRQEEWGARFRPDAMLPRIQKLRGEGKFAEAFAEIEQARQVHPGDEKLARMGEWLRGEEAAKTAVTHQQAVELAARALDAGLLAESEAAMAVVASALLPPLQARACAVAWAMAQGVERGSAEEDARLTAAIGFARLGGGSTTQIEEWEHRRSWIAGRAELLALAESGGNGFDRALANATGEAAERPWVLQAVRRAAERLHGEQKRRQLLRWVVLVPEMRAEWASLLDQQQTSSRGPVYAGVAALGVLALAGGWFLLKPKPAVPDSPPESVLVAKVEPPKPVAIPEPEPEQKKAVVKKTDPVKPQVAEKRPEPAVTPPVPVKETPPPELKNEPKIEPKNEPKPEVVPPKPSMGLAGLRSSEVTWVGALAPDAELQVSGNRPSSGSITAGGLQARPGRIVVEEPAQGISVLAGPSAASGWGSVVLKNSTGRELRRIRLRWLAQ